MKLLSPLYLQVMNFCSLLPLGDSAVPEVQCYELVLQNTVNRY